MLLIFSKIFSTFVTVILLAHIAKRLSPRFAGVLGGFPLGSGLALYFFAWQHGEQFAAQSALASVSGLSASLVFVIVYWLLLKWRPQIRFIPFHTLIAFASFLLSAYIIELLPDNLLLRVTLTLLAILLSRWFFRRIANTQISDLCENRLAKHLKNPQLSLMFRATLATLSILIITGIADSIGATYAGVFAVFPISFFPLMLILHISYGSDILASSIKYYPDGLGALLVYTCAVHLLYPMLGSNWGTLLALLSSCLYLLIYALGRKRFYNAG